MTLHLHHPGRDPEREGIYPHAVLWPRCAAFTNAGTCLRCGAGKHDICGDEDARAAQEWVREFPQVAVKD